MTFPHRDFEHFEDSYQNKFDKIKLPFVPRTVVTVKLLTYQKTSTGLRELLHKHCHVDFIISCSKIDNRRLRSFKTHRIPKNDIAAGLGKMFTSKDLINQTFQFVIPKNVKSDEEIPIQFEICMNKMSFSRHINRKLTINASDLPDDGTVSLRTLVFNHFKVELNVSLQKSVRTKPDFRYSLGLCPGEKKFRKKRIPHVCEAMKKILGEESGPKSHFETPVVSLVGSGGGYRAVAGMCGAMEALKDAGLLDVLTYSSGLSGSSWYLASAYALRGVKPDEQESFHETLRTRFSRNSIRGMVLPQTKRQYEKCLQISCKKHGQPHTFANFFPGFIVGKQLLEETAVTKLSQMIPYVENGTVPYPILVTLQVKNRVRSSNYHAYMERTPYEVSFPSYGISYNTTDDASTWYSGFRVHRCPELPLHFTIAMTGCAMSILLTSYVETGGELDKCFLEHVEQQRIKGKSNTSDDCSFDVSSVNELSLDDLEEPENIKDSFDKPEEKKHVSFANNADDESHDDSISWGSEDDESFEEEEEDVDSPFLHGRINRATVKELKKTNQEFISRNAVVGRTVRLNNFALGMNELTRFRLNPIKRMDNTNGSSGEKKISLGMESGHHRLSTQKDFISIADAGVLNNVATDIVLRPQRSTDVMIVVDFNAYESDDYFDYQPLLVSAAQARQSGIDYPDVKFDYVTNLPPKEFLIFPSNGPNCPTILWFTLSNKKFKELENYIPRSTAKPPVGENRKFNDFEVFGQGTPYATSKFQYNNYHFDQLKELMYYNVYSHIEEIKQSLQDSILQKRQNLQHSNRRDRVVDANS